MLLANLVLAPGAYAGWDHDGFGGLGGDADGDDERGEMGPVPAGAGMECDRGIGEPVDTFMGGATVGPDQLAAIAADDPRFGLSFEATWDSQRAGDDWADSGRSPATSEKPHLRTLGPGFRHSYDQRLVFLPYAYGSSAATELAVWTRADTVKRFIKQSGLWVAETGENLRLVETVAGAQWRLTDDQHNVYVFDRVAGGTQLHPWDNDWSTGTKQARHARLRAIHPGGAAHRMVRLLYEGEAVGSGAQQIPSGVCADLVVGQAACLASRGLLAKVVQVLSTSVEAQSFELRYGFVEGGTTARDQYLIDEIRAGALRNANAPPAFVKLVYDTTRLPRRLMRVEDHLYGPSLTDSGRFRYSYDESDAKKAHLLVAAHEGTSERETFSWSNEMLSCTEENTCGGSWCSGDGCPSTGCTPQNGSDMQYCDTPCTATNVCDRPFVFQHTSKGLTLETENAARRLDRLWIRNGVEEIYTYDEDHRPFRVTHDFNVLWTPYARSSERNEFPPGPWGTTKKLSYQRHDGVWVEDRYDFAVEPHLLARCETLSTHRCTWSTVAGGEEVTLWASTPFLYQGVSRSYFDGDGRLRAHVQLSGSTLETAPQKVLFPSRAAVLSGWAGASDWTGCDGTPDGSYTATFGGKDFDVTVWDYDSNTDPNGSLSIFNEPSSSAAMADGLVARVRRGSTRDGHFNTSCDLFYRNERGDVTASAELVDGEMVSFISYGLVSDSAAKVARGRIGAEIRYTENAIEVFTACDDQPSFDAEGQRTCTETPQEVGDGNRVEVTTTLGAPGGSRLVQTAVSRQPSIGAGTVIWRTYAILDAAHRVEETGVGPRTVTAGQLKGNRTVLYYHLNAERFGELTSLEERSPSGNFLRRWDSLSTDVHDYYWTGNIAGGLSPRSFRREADKNGLTTRMSFVDMLGGERSAGFSHNGGRISESKKDDALNLRYRYNQGGRPNLARVDAKLSIGSDRAVRHQKWTADGLLQEVSSGDNPAYTPFPVLGLKYDGFGRVVEEARVASQGFVAYTWHDRTRPATRKVSDASGGTAVEDLSYEYDWLGRLLREKNGTTTLRLWAYDSKGTPPVVPHPSGTGTFAFTNNFQTGRLAWERATSSGVTTTTYYEYDALGRVVAVAHDEGTPTTPNYKTFLFEYDPTLQPSIGRLTKMTYPGGTVVEYVYPTSTTADAARPTSVKVNGATFISGITYDLEGEPRYWAFAGSTSWEHGVEKDSVGRVVRTYWEVNNVKQNDVRYTYDGDGDLLSESDNQSTSANTWLSMSGSGGQLRAYGYADGDKNTPFENVDLLHSWFDNGAAETVNYDDAGRKLRFAADGRVFKHNYNATYGERLAPRSLDPQGATCGSGLPTCPSGTACSAGLGRCVSNREANVAYGPIGLITSIDWRRDSTIDLGFAYEEHGAVGAFGDAVSGIYRSFYDARMRRTRLQMPSGATRRTRFAMGRTPLQEATTSSAGALIDAHDFIYLGAIRIGDVAKGTGSSSATYRVFTDRMGVPRRWVNASTGTSARRLVLDAWGTSNATNAGVVQDAGCNPCSPAPSVTSRFPGQTMDAAGVVNNGWRTYVPELGQYTSPEPLHVFSSVVHLGSLAYTYSAGRPLRLVDPTGLVPWTQAYSTPEAAAAAAFAEYGKRSIDDSAEFSGLVFTRDGQDGYFYTEMLRNLLPSRARKSSPEQDELIKRFGSKWTSQTRAIAGCHTHGRSGGADYFDEVFSGRGPCTGPGCYSPANASAFQAYGDMDSSRKYGLPEFLFTPSGKTFIFFPHLDETRQIPSSGGR